MLIESLQELLDYGSPSQRMIMTWWNQLIFMMPKLIPLSRRDVGSMSLLRQIQEFSNKGLRREAVALARQHRLSSGVDEEILCEEIINLLCKGRKKRAKVLFEKYFSCSFADEPLLWKIHRYLYPKPLRKVGALVLEQTRYCLHRSFDKSMPKSEYLGELLNEFSHYILISNSSLIELSDQDCQYLKSLPRPLFVYQNIGNPLLSRKRVDFYNGQAKELILGGFKNIADYDGKIIFEPISRTSLIGCLVRVNPKFYKVWHESIRSGMSRSNPGILISVIEESLLIDSLFPLSSVQGKQGPQKRICTNGWLALSLFDALITYQPERDLKMLTIGFDLSASYIFEACRSIDFHDFSFERHCLRLRYQNPSVFRIGQMRRSSSELTTKNHMDEAGVTRRKLADVRRETGRWPNSTTNENR